MKSRNSIIVRSGDLVYIQFKIFSDINFLRHCFSTRLGGVSKGFVGSMNLSFHRDDERDNVIKNYEILCSAAGISTDDLVLSKQTHTDFVRTVGFKDRGTGFSKPEFEDVDGLVTSEKNVALVTQYADCTPLIFCDPKNRVIASSHAGWRGTVKKIGLKTVEKMVGEFGCRRENIKAAIGPCIHSCCYEVDGPVFEQFKKAGFKTNEILKQKGGGKYMLDLPEANKDVLLQSGLRSENIEISDLCTCCNSSELFSHRASGGKRGNLAAIIEMV